MHPRGTSWSSGCVYQSTISLVLAAIAVGVPFRLAAGAGVSRAQAAAAWAGPGQMTSALSKGHQSYDEAFAELAARFRREGWEARQEEPPQAYLHVSKPGWRDGAMNGIHFETYVLAGQLKSGFAPVMLHCERGFPLQAKFMHAFTHKARTRMEALGYEVQGPSGCSVCEKQVPLGFDAMATIDALETELRHLQKELAPLIDATIREVQTNAS
jgi:hypothetical protein